MIIIALVGGWWWYVLLLLLLTTSSSAAAADPNAMFHKGFLGKVPSFQEDALATKLMDILTLHAGATGLERLRLATVGGGGGDASKPSFTNVGQDGNYHFRFWQYLDDVLPIQGAAIVMHVKGGSSGSGSTVYAVNGEFVAHNSSDLIVNQTNPNLNCSEAMEIALQQVKNLQEGNYTKTQWVSPCVEAAVRGRDQKIYKGYQQKLLYNKYQYANVFASGWTGDLVAFHPLTYTSRQLVTKNCQKTIPVVANCPNVSTSSDPINTKYYPVDDAHNYAILTYNFYFEQFGRDSLDGNGMALVSGVDWSDSSCPNAFYSDGEMYYCPEDTTFGLYAFSRASDVVAHEVRK